MPSWAGQVLQMTQSGPGPERNPGVLVRIIGGLNRLRQYSPRRGRWRLILDKFQIGVHFVALAAAFALAIPIGWDREKKARSAGLRTFPLVALASCGFVQASENLLLQSPDGMAKVIEGLITGIGFIGGGAILKQGTMVHGTATAASLWATGAIGVSVGLGSYDVAVTISVFTFLTLRLLTIVKQEGNLAGADEPHEGH